MWEIWSYLLEKSGLTGCGVYAGGVEWILIKDHSRLIESRVCGGGGVFIACSHFHPSVNLQPPFHYPSLPPRYHLPTLPTSRDETPILTALQESPRWRFERGFTFGTLETTIMDRIDFFPRTTTNEKLKRNH